MNFPVTFNQAKNVQLIFLFSYTKMENVVQSALFLNYLMNIIKKPKLLMEDGLIARVAEIKLINNIMKKTKKLKNNIDKKTKKKLKLIENLISQDTTNFEEIEEKPMKTSELLQI